MNLLGGLTDQPKQTTTIVLADGTRATLALEYRPNQLAWFYDLEWEGLAINGCRLVASPNIVREFRLRIPFGLAVITAGNIDPTDQEAFVNGSASVYLLDAQDVLDVEAAIFDPDL